MRSTCTSAFIPPWAISLPPSLKANGRSSKLSRPTFTKNREICVQPNGGSTHTITRFPSLMKEEDESSLKCFFHCSRFTGVIKQLDPLTKICFDSGIDLHSSHNSCLSR